MHAVEGFTYYSNTHDVIAWPSEDEGPFRILASFASRAEAVAYAKNAPDALCVRPPKNALVDAVAFLTYVLAQADYNVGGDVKPPAATY